jgi:hypothetical protein
MRCLEPEIPGGTRGQQPGQRWRPRFNVARDSQMSMGPPQRIGEAVSSRCGSAGVSSFHYLQLDIGAVVEGWVLTGKAGETTARGPSFSARDLVGERLLCAVDTAPRWHADSVLHERD